ncbi:MAG TPA: DUF5666 domain-containing protein [Hypericibacter adhaerens]|uniref:DUF5666 domain-containing protein n=1 Tax=Hypericibacter adhaerens TaxID=2602016 RepID=UPI001CD9A9E3|nr:DUF5666 domain-containing protein [Hypericibacter adhaerens]HWA44229.1 DUF5666 domain-containing protein [Hypericibacter adhaerens]
MRNSSIRFIFGPLLRSGLAAVLLLVASQAWADDAPPARIRGTIKSVAADTLTVETNGGTVLDVALDGKTSVHAITLGTVEEIQPGRYIGVTAVPQGDGTLKALEVHVFPPDMAGTGDGHRPWDLAPDSSMTNGLVGELATSNGRMITVKYKDGQQQVAIPDGMPVVNIEPGDRSLLTPGTHVMIFAQKNADGTLVARFISAGKNGVKPPM